MSILKNEKFNIDRLLSLGKKPMATSEIPQNDYYSFIDKKEAELEPEKEKPEKRTSGFEARFQFRDPKLLPPRPPPPLPDKSLTGQTPHTIGTTGRLSQRLPRFPWPVHQSSPTQRTMGKAPIYNGRFLI